jgi:hypothetical protein
VRLRGTTVNETPYAPLTQDEEIRLLTLAEQSFRADLETASETGNMSKRLKSALFRGTTGRALCETSARCLAHVHGDVEVGNHIFVPRGATVPLIVQPTGNDKTFNDAKQSLRISTFYKLVGRSYVYGIMDGELSGMMDGVRLREETIYLIQASSPSTITSVATQFTRDDDLYIFSIHTEDFKTD